MSAGSLIGEKGAFFSDGPKAGTSGAVNLSKTPSMGADGGVEQAVMASMAVPIVITADAIKIRVFIGDQRLSDVCDLR